MLAREKALSPIPLPDSKLFKNQVSCTKARMRACVRACVRGAAQSTASLFTPPGLVPSQPRSSSQRDQTSDAQMCARALCSNNGLLSTQRAWVSLSSLATYISHHYGRLSGPNGTTSILQINYWPYFSNTLRGAPGGTLGIPVAPCPSSSEAGVLLFAVGTTSLLGMYIHTVQTFAVGRWLMAKRKGHQPLKCAHKGRITVGVRGGEPATLE